MTREPVCPEADSGVMDASEAAAGAGVRRLPVVEDGGELAAIVTLDDLDPLLSDGFRNLATSSARVAPLLGGLSPGSGAQQS